MITFLVHFPDLKNALCSDIINQVTHFLRTLEIQKGW